MGVWQVLAQAGKLTAPLGRQARQADCGIRSFDCWQRMSSPPAYRPGKGSGPGNSAQALEGVLADHWRNGPPFYLVSVRVYCVGGGNSE